MIKTEDLNDRFPDCTVPLQPLEVSVACVTKGRRDLASLKSCHDAAARSWDSSQSISEGGFDSEVQASGAERRVFWCVGRVEAFPLGVELVILGLWILPSCVKGGRMICFLAFSVSGILRIKCLNQ